MMTVMAVTMVMMAMLGTIINNKDEDDDGDYDDGDYDDGDHDDYQNSINDD